MLGYIYTLSCPFSGLVKYVGQTIDLQKRYNLHLFHSKKGRARTHKEKWINKLLASGQKPVLEVVWEGDVSHLDKKETEFIALFKSFGAKLTNATLGGLTTRGRKCSEATKQKFRELFTGKYLRPPMTDEERKAASLRRSNGWKPTPEAIEKMRQSKTGKPGRPLSEENKQKFIAKALMLSKPIIAVFNGVEIEYPSIKEAARQTNTDKTSIQRFLKCKRKSVKGYQFKYAA